MAPYGPPAGSAGPGHTPSGRNTRSCTEVRRAPRPWGLRGGGALTSALPPRREAIQHPLPTPGEIKLCDFGVSGQPIDSMANSFVHAVLHVCESFRPTVPRALLQSSSPTQLGCFPDFQVFQKPTSSCCAISIFAAGFSFPLNFQSPSVSSTWVSVSLPSSSLLLVKVQLRRIVSQFLSQATILHYFQ